MQMEESTKIHGNFNGRGVKIKLLLPQPFKKKKKKQVKKGGKVVREMLVRRRVVFAPHKKIVYYNYQ